MCDAHAVCPLYLVRGKSGFTQIMRTNKQNLSTPWAIKGAKLFFVTLSKINDF